MDNLRPDHQQDDLRYPIGKQPVYAAISAQDRLEGIHVLSEFPGQLQTALRELDDAQLDTPYREGGWTVRQLVHHIADSHATALFRMRKALTEDWSAVPAYPENLFAELADRTAPVTWSLNIIEGVHARWVRMIEGLTDSEWKRGVVHSAAGRNSVEAMLMTYRWHSLHHLAHITGLRERRGW